MIKYHETFNYSTLSNITLHLTVIWLHTNYKMSLSQHKDWRESWVVTLFVLNWKKSLHIKQDSTHNRSGLLIHNPATEVLKSFSGPLVQDASPWHSEGVSMQHKTPRKKWIPSEKSLMASNNTHKYCKTCTVQCNRSSTLTKLISYATLPPRNA